MQGGFRCGDCWFIGLVLDSYRALFNVIYSDKLTNFRNFSGWKIHRMWPFELSMWELLPLTDFSVFSNQDDPGFGLLVNGRPTQLTDLAKPNMFGLFLQDLVLSLDHGPLFS